MAVTVPNVVAQCSHTDGYQRFLGKCCLHLHGRRHSPCILPTRCYHVQNYTRCHSSQTADWIFITFDLYLHIFPVLLFFKYFSMISYFPYINEIRNNSMGRFTLSRFCVLKMGINNNNNNLTFYVPSIVTSYINKPTRYTSCMYLFYNFCTTLHVSKDHFVHNREFMIYCTVQLCTNRADVSSCSVLRLEQP